ncbi:TetR/AcrR family transcriptional regulator [Shewanella intestini]|uniref:TetR/AcrR family transcriptional regulator n=1 Tax=Shewanella intestini TaxID=2017544 RepID=A0ABS5I187_9GAMM|nr:MULTISPECIES: TetR/AcrR family transcriptional regulator [Shewanella]MBR9727777.1 TetR/AcrR family transcriptional regulator [Shewanella intestini]MRG36230.1 TetR family transcriptional regulator [Shewanella sp. XMDDZSB0408]
MQIDKLNSILNSAEALILKQGIMSFKISELAKLAKCSNATLYSEFNNKEEIVYTLYLRATKNKVKRITNIVEMDGVSNKDKIIIISMLDIFQSFVKTLNLSILSNLPNNENLSITTKGSCVKEFYKLKEIYDKLWREAIDNKELLSTKEDVIALSYELIIYHKGVIEFINDYNLNKIGWNMTPEMFFEYIVKKINSLDWVDHSTIDYQSTCSLMHNELLTSSFHKTKNSNENVFESEMDI